MTEHNQDVVPTSTSTELKDVNVPTTLWHIHGIELSKSHRRHQFQIADWLLEGIELLGAVAAYDSAEALFPQYARATFTSWVTVAKHFPASMRIESDFLTFNHYQVVQGTQDKVPDDDSYELALESAWLRKADEQKMSVSVLREAIHACEISKRAIANVTEEADRALVEAHKEWEKAEPTREDFITQKWVSKELKKQELPSWLDKRLRWGIQELAKARHQEPHEIVLRAVADFIDAHSEELGNAKEAEAKRAAEHKAAWAAAENAVAEKNRLRPERIIASQAYKDAKLKLQTEAAEKARAERDQYDAGLRRIDEMLKPFFDWRNRADANKIDIVDHDASVAYRCMQNDVRKHEPIEQIESWVLRILEQLPVSVSQAFPDDEPVFANTAVAQPPEPVTAEATDGKLSDTEIEALYAAECGVAAD